MAIYFVLNKTKNCSIYRVSGITRTLTGTNQNKKERRMNHGMDQRNFVKTRRRGWEV